MARRLRLENGDDAIVRIGCEIGGEMVELSGEILVDEEDVHRGDALIHARRPRINLG
jgi:hypothetical protein